MSVSGMMRAPPEQAGSSIVRPKLRLALPVAVSSRAWPASEIRIWKRLSRGMEKGRSDWWRWIWKQLQETSSSKAWSSSQRECGMTGETGPCWKLVQAIDSAM